MRRMVAPNDTVREVEIQGARTGASRTYRWSKDGTVHVESERHVKALRAAGFTEAGLTGTATNGGYSCKACGFAAWFKTCSRCGGECERG
jgi:hypothetical protein